MAAATCPVCHEKYEDAFAFALHVAECTTPRDASAPSAAAAPTASCPMCHAVYTSEMAPHEIEFHEEECERVNEYVGPIVPMSASAVAAGGAGGGSSGGSRGPASGAKRSRDSATAAATSSAAAAPVITLFPANCAVCDSGGRTLLHCSGKCARSFHPLCIEEINAKDFAADGTTKASSSGGSTAPASTVGHVSFATAIARDKKALRMWTCGECTRGLHTCQLCGFLGHEGHEIARCSLPNCGFFFHTACLRGQNHRVQSPLVCQRHTCSACNAIETDMTQCTSCTKCCKSVHTRCRESIGDASTSATQTRGRGEVLDPNFHVCDAHKPEVTQTAAATGRKLAQFAGLKMHIRPGDIVMILEYGNLLLPSTAKEAAPQAYNQWGIVQRAENLGDGISPAWWTQLLTVVLFSDNSSISVPNRYVLPLGTIRHYSSPTQMVRDAIKWHAMNEIHARHLEQHLSDASSPQSTVLSAVVLAFQERAKALGLSSADCMANAGDGFAAWQRFMGAASQSYQDTSAPVYVALDSRGATTADIGNSGLSESSDRAKTRSREGSAHDDSDVDMDDSRAQSERQTDATSSKSNAPHVRSANDAVREPVGEGVKEAVARLIEAVEADNQRGTLLGGSRELPNLTQSLKDLVNQLEDDDMNEDMDGVVDLQLANADEDEGAGFENRLSIDDLLNPLSQDSMISPTLAPSPSPHHQDTTQMDKDSPLQRRRNESTELDKDSVQTQKRALDDVGRKMIDMTPTVKENGPESHRSPANKKPKLHHESKTSGDVRFSLLPVNINKLRGSVFSRPPLSIPPALTAKEKLATEVSSHVLHDLQLHVDAFFGKEDEMDEWSFKRAPAIRPAFYRPAPFLYCGPRVGRRVDAISRLLLCQDKRNLKCFLRQAHPSGASSTIHSGRRSCSFEPARDGRLSYISVDLMGIPNFPTLEKEVRGRVATALSTSERSSGWNVTSEARDDDPRDPEIQLSYCVYDGSEHVLPTHKFMRMQQPEWLCFCANVVHLTATVVAQH